MALRIRCRLAYLAPFACGKAQYATLGETLYESGAVLAMRQKPFDRTPSVLARLLARLGVSVDDAPHGAEVEARETVIPEDILVALSTIQHCYPDWLEDEKLFEDFAGYLKRQKVALPGISRTILMTSGRVTCLDNTATCL